ncbi:MAG: hypothetical protein HKN28_20355 [Alphaproteobacteria bacterium]|nr:hypothetical protein [Alphaproteobacteria bacterium]
MVNIHAYWRPVLLLTFMVILAACNQSEALQPTTSASDSETSQSFALLTDIPIPPGADLDVEKSLVLGDLDRWTGRVILDVDQSATKAFGLYQSEMPNFGWSPVMSVQAGVSVLTFTRGERAATIQIENNTIRGSTVSITVAPRQTAPIPGTTAPSTGSS